MLAFDLSKIFGRVRVRGNTRIDFLHRMSSGEVRYLKPGQGATTVLTTPNGRTIDYLVVLPFVDSLLLLTGGGNQDKVAHWLRKYVFFNDDVHISDESAEQHMLGIFGDGADAFIHSAAGHAADHIEDKPRYTFAATQDVVVIKAPPMQGAGYYLIRAKPGAAADANQSVSAPLSHISYDDLRIAHGYPRFPNEIGEDYIPLETGLMDAISFSKGCYVGQEIIARMDSRGQIAKRLVQLDALHGEVRQGDEIVADGHPIGKITSAQSAAAMDGHRFALGYVRSAYAEPGQGVEIGPNRTSGVVVQAIGIGQQSAKIARFS
jgi:aminomethyltransferase